MPTDPSIWTRSIPFVENGQPVNANVTNAPTQVLADRTAALKQLVDAIEAGQQLVLRDAPLGSDIASGTVVFFDAQGLVHAKAQAQWNALDEGVTELYPAPEAIYVGVVTQKSADRVGDILINGFAVLDDAALTNLFGTTDPESGQHYLSMVTPGTVELPPPAMKVRVLEYTTGGIIRVYPPQHEPVTHTHRKYRLGKDDWAVAASFEPTLIPDDAKFGYNLLSPAAVEQNIGDALIPSVGEPSFVYLYHEEGASAESSAEECPLGGKHVNELSIDLDANGVWWNEYAEPGCDIEMTVTSADAHGASLLYAIQSLSPEAIQISTVNGIVSVTLLDMEDDLDTAGHIVVKDIIDYRKKRGPVVSSFNVGIGLRRSSPQGEGVGDITTEIELFNNLLIEASLQNLNNAITSVEAPHVITLFPSNRAAEVACQVVLPNLGDIDYRMRVFAQFISPGPSQTPPTIETTLIPTPSVDGVTPVGPAASSFPNFPASVNAGDVYYVESDDEYSLSGFSRGLVSFVLAATEPTPELRMINTGIRLYLP